MTANRFYKVLINSHLYEVEIVDLLARPVLAVVNGKPIEVWPEAKVVAAEAPVPQGETEESGDSQVREILAPMPGTIVSVAVEQGSQVAYGQELCVLEAMKMKNVIRAPRTGTIGKVSVTQGQSVKHHDLLVEYRG
jgi:biotin carboxyl carrier protein